MIKIIVIIALIIAISSCSDDKGTNTIQHSPDMPLSEGKTFEYDYYYFDEGKFEKINYEAIDIIGSKTTYKGRDAYIYEKHLSYNSTAITHISKDKEGIFYYYKKLEPGAEPFDFVEPGWIKIVDYENDNWESYNEEFTLSEGEVEAKAHIIISGTNLGREEVIYNDKTYNAYKFQSKAEAEVLNTADNEILLKGSTTVEYLIIDGLGIYSQVITMDEGKGNLSISKFVLK